jgi:hypothetical protein
MYKKIILTIISVFLLTISGCNDEYDVTGPLDDNLAIIVNVFIHNNNVDWKEQRSFYDHDAKVVTVRIVPGSLTEAEYANLLVFVNPSFQTTMTPIGGNREDWSSGSRTYTLTSGDGATTNVYTVQIVEDLIL